jgi:hypothetical protein
MAKINITTIWPGRTKRYMPGVYAIPEDISRLEALCCVADRAGQMIEEAKRERAPFREVKPGGKSPAPENKQRGAAPENKTAVADLLGGGNRAVTDA